TIVDVVSEEEPAEETVCDVVETEAEPIAETATDSAEAEPVVETVCDVVTEEEPAPEAACEVATEDETETVAGVPEHIEVTDETADLMKITVPCLCMCDDLMLELAKDCERTIPDDGLEAYDCVFRSKMSPAKEECTCTSSAPEKKKSAGKPDPYYNFRID
ncbi:MAG: hypothetical protein FWF07_01610, partial [Methanomassiliicoccaceae archaeon]|nr:hypothetical protein [Methanomassiliicoccaceae archaeon]